MLGGNSPQRTQRTLRFYVLEHEDTKVGEGYEDLGYGREGYLGLVWSYAFCWFVSLLFGCAWQRADTRVRPDDGVVG